MSELSTVISKVAKKFPKAGYDKKGASIYNTYRDAVMSGSIPVFSFTSTGKPETTAKYIASITGYNASDCLNFMSELFNLTKNGVVSNKLINPKLDIQQAVSTKTFKDLKPGIMPKMPDTSTAVTNVQKNIRKVTLPIVIPAIVIIGLIVVNNVVKLKKTVRKTL
jgi:hypothetical protein